MNDLAIPIEGCGGLFHMRQFAGVITFRIGDLGFVLRTPTLWAGSRFRIENTKTKLEKHLRIPQSAFPNPQSSSPVLQKSSPSFLVNPSNFGLAQRSRFSTLYERVGEYICFCLLEKPALQEAGFFSFHEYYLIGTEQCTSGSNHCM
jgi:hypothetical protein